MFWKIAKLCNIFRGQWSITMRLALIYTFSAFCILVVSAFSLYYIFTSRLEKENYRTLINNIIILEKIIQTSVHSRKSSLQDALREEVILEPPINHYYVRLIDDQGNIFMQTPRMHRFIPPDLFKDIIPDRAGFYLTKYWNAKIHSKERKFLLITARINQKSAVSSYWIVEIAMDISAEWDIIFDYRRDLEFVLLISIICTAGVGILVTRKGLQPLRDMTLSAQRITIHSLKERLNPNFWPKELSMLAIAYNNMLNRMEEGFTRLSQFSGDLAHELRTPINNLMGEAEIALSRGRSNEEYKEVLESSTEELNRLSCMIENLLFLARAENPIDAVAFIMIDVHTIMKDVIDFYEAAAEEKGVKITYEGKETIKADTLMLRRAISNLVSNALKHSNKDSQIILSTGKNMNQIFITVQDEGFGIAPEHLPRLFDRFYRVDSARSQKTGGTGLGLAIVKFIMDLHKGDVHIQSEPGKGTKVSLLFPI